MLVLPHLAVLLAAGLGPSEAPPARAATAAPTDQKVQPASDGIAGELAQTEAMHRAIVRGPIEGWQLEPVKTRYEALLPRAGDSATAATIRARLASVTRQEAILREALTFESVLRTSRARDAEVAGARRELAGLKRAERPAFAAEGLIQPSSRKVEGQKVLALIGPDGFAVAYLRIPPGLDTRHLFARRVGVRGDVHYDDKLRARVIAVNDIEPLEDAREPLRPRAIVR